MIGMVGSMTSLLLGVETWAHKDQANMFVTVLCRSTKMATSVRSVSWKFAVTRFQKRLLVRQARRQQNRGATNDAAKTHARTAACTCVPVSLCWLL